MKEEEIDNFFEVEVPFCESIRSHFSSSNDNTMLILDKLLS